MTRSVRAATARAIFTASATATTPTRPPPMPMPAVPQGTGQGGAALLHGPCADREPQRAGGRRGGDPRLGARRAAGGAGLDRTGCRPAAAGDIGAPTKATTAATSPWSRASRRSFGTSPRTRAGGARRSTGAPLAIPATRSRSVSASALKKSSVAPRASPGCASCGTAACPRSIDNSPWQWPPAISSGCPNC